jgi:hypothetical protein
MGENMNKSLISNNHTLRGTSLTYNRISMDKVRTIIREVCEKDPCANVEIAVSYGSNGSVETRNIIITSGAVSVNACIPDILPNNS